MRRLSKQLKRRLVFNLLRYYFDNMAGWCRIYASFSSVFLTVRIVTPFFIFAYFLGSTYIHVIYVSVYFNPMAYFFFWFI